MYAPDTIILEIRSKVKITVTQKHRHPKMHPHTQFGISTSNNIGESVTDGWTHGIEQTYSPKTGL